MRRPAAASGGWATARAMAAAVLVALCIRCFLCEVFQIPSGSMIPTLEVGDRILVNKFLYGPRIPFTQRRLWALSPPKRGEVAVFIAPGRATPGRRRQDFIKRVVGLPGDTIEVRGGRVLINGGVLSRIPLGAARVMDRDERTGVWAPLSADAFVEKFDPDPLGGGGQDAAGDDGFTVLVDRALPPASRDLPPTRVPPGHVFFMGDNRYHSSDSREWGVVPMGALLGRASFVIFSWGEHGPSFRRTGAAVHRPALPERP